jgi:hypothetical protein
MEGSSEHPEQAVAEGRQRTVLQLSEWAEGYKFLTVKNEQLVTKSYTGPGIKQILLNVLY